MSAMKYVVSEVIDMIYDLSSNETIAIYLKEQYKFSHEGAYEFIDQVYDTMIDDLEAA